MRIAQVSPLAESVPPKNYGGTERIVSYLTEELVNQGHEVTLFASGDSQAKARLIAPCSRSLRSNPDVKDPVIYSLVQLEEVFRCSADYDIIHFHLDYLHFPFCRRANQLQVTTLHGRLDLPDLKPLFEEYSDMPLISISDSQRQPFPHLNWQGTVYHGIPLELYTFRQKPGDYLAFLGRVSPEKRLDRAIEIAQRFGVKLKVAAKIDPVDQEYFRTELEPKIGQADVEFLGEIGEKDKDDFLGNAYAFLFPIDWPEPFGLVMIEAMACGTPVVAWSEGAVPEVMQNGITGFIVGTIEGAVTALHEVKSLDRKRCREAFERRFSAGRMARDYLKIYQRMVGESQRSEVGNQNSEPQGRFKMISDF